MYDDTACGAPILESNRASTVTWPAFRRPSLNAAIAEHKKFSVYQNSTLDHYAYILYCSLESCRLSVDLKLASGSVSLL
jgi:hypothetical protein